MLCQENNHTQTEIYEDISLASVKNKESYFSENGKSHKQINKSLGSVSSLNLCSQVLINWVTVYLLHLKFQQLTFPFRLVMQIQTIAIKIQKTQMGNYINISFAVNLIEVFFFNFLLSLKDKQVDRRRMLTLGSQADVDKAGRYHLTKNEILGRSSSGKRHLREPKMKTVSREILSTQSLCQERPPQPQKEPTVYISSNITHSSKAPNCPGRLYI